MEVDLRNKEILELDFSSHNASTASEREKQAVTDIEVIRASSNQISKLQNLSIFVRLVSLDLSKNKLSSPIINWLDQLPPSLLSLNLSFNSISSVNLLGASTSDFGNSESLVSTFLFYLPKLEILDLSHNEIVAHSVDSVANLARGHNDNCDGGVDDGTHTKGILGGEQQPIQSKQRKRADPLINRSLQVLSIAQNAAIHSLNTLLQGLFGLQELHAESNMLESMCSIEELASECPRLEAIYLYGNPLFQSFNPLLVLPEGGILPPNSEMKLQQSAPFLADTFAVSIVKMIPQIAVVDGVVVAEAQERLREFFFPTDASPEHPESREVEPVPTARAPETLSLLMSDDDEVSRLHPIIQEEEGQQNNSSNSPQEGENKALMEGNDEWISTEPLCENFDEEEEYVHDVSDFPSSHREEVGDDGWERKRSRAYRLLMDSFLTSHGPTKITREEFLVQRETQLYDFILESQAASQSLVEENAMMESTVSSKRQLVGQQVHQLNSLKQLLAQLQKDEAELRTQIDKKVIARNHSKRTLQCMEERQVIFQEQLQKVAALKKEHSEKVAAQKPLRRQPGKAIVLTNAVVKQLEATRNKMAKMALVDHVSATKFKFSPSNSLPQTSTTVPLCNPVAESKRNAQVRGNQGFNVPATPSPNSPKNVSRNRNNPVKSAYMDPIDDPTAQSLNAKLLAAQRGDSTLEVVVVGPSYTTAAIVAPTKPSSPPRQPKHHTTPSPQRPPCSEPWKVLERKPPSSTSSPIKDRVGGALELDKSDVRTRQPDFFTLTKTQQSTLSGTNSCVRQPHAYHVAVNGEIQRQQSSTAMQFHSWRVSVDDANILLPAPSGVRVSKSAVDDRTLPKMGGAHLNSSREALVTPQEQQSKMDDNREKKDRPQTIADRGTVGGTVRHGGAIPVHSTRMAGWSVIHSTVEPI